MPNSSKTRRLNARPRPRNDAEEVAKDGCLHLWRKAAAAGGLRRLSRSLAQCRRLDRYASGPSCRHAGLPLPSAAGPRVGGADRRVSRPSAPPRRADYPCADHFAQTRRRRRQRSESGVAAVFPLYAGNIPNADEHGIEGTRWTEFVTRVEPEDLTVNTKKRLSAFYPTDLDFLLRNLDVRTVVLNGGFTDCCILNAAFEASNLGYNLVVLRDLVRGTNEEMEDAALKMVSLHLGLVFDSADLLDGWRTSAGSPSRPNRV